MNFLNAGMVGVGYKVIVRSVIEIIKINGVRITPIILSSGVRITPIILSGGVGITLVILSDIVSNGVRKTLVISSNIKNKAGGNKMNKIKTLALKEPQVKYNLKLTPSDFREATETGWEIQLLGEDIYIINVKIPYKYLYIPPSPFDVYLYSNKYTELIKAPQGVFVLMDIVDIIILVKPSGLLSGNIYFQYWLSNVETIRILDVYEKMNFDVTATNYVNIEIPFPTYEMMLLMLIPSPSDNWGFDIDIYPFNTNDTLVLDDVSGLIATDTVVNTIYKYHFIGGSGAVSDPHYTRPSYRTRIKISNNDTGSDMLSLRLQLVSFED